MIAACFVTLLGACGRNEKETGKAEIPTPAPTRAAPKSNWTPRPLIESNATSLPNPTETPEQSFFEAEESIPSPTASLHPIDAATEEKIEMLRKRGDDLLGGEFFLTPTP